MVAMERDASGAEIDVSVLIPVLNEEEHIGEAARSMLAQRFDESVEFLYIDGRSEDSTRAILEELAAGDARVRILDNPRRTTPHALNLGLAAARGEHVVRMDAHTYYPPHYIATGVARLRQGDVDWVCGPQVPLGSGRWSRVRYRAFVRSSTTTRGSLRRRQFSCPCPTSTA